ncbi:MAG: hypothetical protein GX557_08885 [Chloroflexi bacterium]|nr:hypothetical protein [Chloroflexota bacterium]
MAMRERVLDYLHGIAPQAASNRQIAEALEASWPKTVYRATARLCAEGLVQRTAEGQHWLFSVGAPVPDAGLVLGVSDTVSAECPVAAEGAPLPAEGAQDESPGKAAQARRRTLLKDLLSLPEGRVWFLERLRCPCTREQACAAGVALRSRPLRDVLEEDYAACAGSVEAQERLAQTYNDCFRLAEDCGIRKVWRADRPTAMRLPLPAPHAGWTKKLLQKHIASRRYLRRALRALRLVQTRVDALVLAGSNVVLVQCAQADSITAARLARLKSLGGVLERRLHRRYTVAGVVDSPDQLALLETAHVLWADVLAWLEREGGNPQD